MGHVDGSRDLVSYNGIALLVLVDGCVVQPVAREIETAVVLLAAGIWATQGTGLGAARRRANAADWRVFSYSDTDAISLPVILYAELRDAE